MDNVMDKILWIKKQLQIKKIEQKQHQKQHQKQRHQEQHQSQ